jgi:CDP-diacylglycerol--inositol 3-phosphatidyltransferase
MLVAFYLCFTSPLLAAVCYCVSQGLDAVDGMVARHFKQCSKFGAVLDMLTDR